MAAAGTEWRLWWEETHVMMCTAEGGVSQRLQGVCLMNYEMCVQKKKSHNHVTDHISTVQLQMEYAGP